MNINKNIIRRERDSNPRDTFDAYTISNRAPSTNSDTSPYWLPEQDSNL